MAFLSRYRTLLLIVLCGLVALYALLGFFGVPYAVKAYGIPALAERLQHPVLLKEISFNPFTFALTLSEFEVQQPDLRPMLGFGELFVDFEATSVLRSSYLFDEIRLTFPFGFVHRPANGTLNLLGLVPPAADKVEGAEPGPPSGQEKHSELPPIDIRLLNITQGVIEYRDDTKRKPIMIDVVPIEITLQNFSTRRGEENAYAFTAEFGQGETLAWEGALHLDPLQSAGKVTLSNVMLTTFWPSIRDQFRFDIVSGAIQVDVRYRFDMNEGPLNLQLSHGKIALSDFRLAAARGRDPVITVPSLTLDAIRLDLPKRELGIGTVAMTGAEIRAWLEQDGAVNFRGLFAPVAQDEGAEPSASEAAPPWMVAVEKVEVAKTHVAFEDRGVTPSVQVGFDDLHLTMSELHVPPKGSFPVAAGFRLNQQGTFEGNGAVQLDPFETTLSLKVAHIGLRPFQPYLNRAVQFEIKDGELGLEGELVYRSRHESEPMLRYAGQAGLNKLHLADRVSEKEFLGWTALELSSVALAVAPTKVKIGEIALADPAIRLMIAKDGTTNLSRLMQAPETAAQPAASKQAEVASSKKSTTPTPIEIDTVRLSKLSAAFVDESIEPIVSTGIQNLSGTITGLSSKHMAKAKVSLAGKVDEVAPLKIQGQINPLSEEAFTRLTFLSQGVDLTAVSPYVGKYVGFPLTKGKLSLDLMYQVSKQQLVGENKVLIDQLTFGEKTGSPDATSLPVRLAVGLLKDRRGRIDIDMPVRGDLNEPDFRYGRVVLNALVNLITKVATSPFSALGGLVGGGGEELQFVEFQAGSESLDSAEQRKLESIAKALQERPALRVDVTGSADPARDRKVLALQKISADVQRRFTHGGTKNLEAVMSASREFELLSDLYAEKLGKQPMKREELPGGKFVERVLTVDELRQQLFPAMPVEESELRILAQGRAKAIREHLIEQGGMPEERVFLVEAELAASEGQQVRVHLNLTGN